MLNFTIRRLLFTIPVLLFISFAIFLLLDLGSCSHRHDFPTPNSWSRSKVNEMIGCPHRLFIVLHNNDRIAQIAQLFQGGQ